MFDTSVESHFLHWYQSCFINATRAKTKNRKFIPRTPHALDNVCGPRIDAVGRFLESFFAALARGKEKAIVRLQIPSRREMQWHEMSMYL